MVEWSASVRCSVFPRRGRAAVAGGAGVEREVRLNARRHPLREELADRTVGPELDPSDLDPQMTVADAAEAMAALLARAGDRDDDEQW